MGNISATETNNKISFDLNEYPIEDIFLDNGCSEIISEQLDRDLVENVEKESSVLSMDIATSEEVDKDGTETNCIPFVGQIFLSEEEAYVFYKRYAYQQGFSIKKKVDS